MRRIMRFVCAGVLGLSVLLGSVLAWAAPLGASISLLNEPEEVEPELSVTMMHTDAEISYKWSPTDGDWVNNSAAPYSRLDFTNKSTVAVDVLITITDSATPAKVTGAWLSQAVPENSFPNDGVSPVSGSGSITLVNLQPEDTAIVYLFYGYDIPEGVANESGTTTLAITITRTETGGKAL